MSHRAQGPTRGVHHLFLLLCVSVPAFMINLDSNIVAVSLPSIAHALTAEFSGIEWVVGANIGSIAYAATLLTMLTYLPLYFRGGLHFGLADRLTTLHALALGSFGSGYEAILVAAAALAGVAALPSWILVRAADTAPMSHSDIYLRRTRTKYDDLH